MAFSFAPIGENVTEQVWQQWFVGLNNLLTIDFTPVDYPIGCIVPYPDEDSAPSDWLFCDGVAYDADTNTIYQPLYDVIGNTFGGTDNTDFQVPNLHGRIPYMAATLGDTADIANGTSDSDTYLSMAWIIRYTT